MLGLIEANEVTVCDWWDLFAPAPLCQPCSTSLPCAVSYSVFDLAQLPELLRQQVIDEVIFAITKDDLERLGDSFRACEVEGVKSRVLLTFFPHEISKVYLEHLGEKPLLTFATTPENDYLLLLKRVLDFVLALTLLVLLSPLMALVALFIRLTSGSPVLFRQTRCGLSGRKFTLYKFRSMRPDADLRREELEALNEVDGPVFKISHDPRCTPIGRFMRKFSLDELPQLLNILKGDMSFVGPRPPLPEEVVKYESWQRRRLRMLPGSDLPVGARRAQSLELPPLDGARPRLYRPLVACPGL